MKYLVKIALGLFVYMAAVASCKDDDDSGITGFSIDKEDITMGADGGKDIVTVSSGGEWAVSAFLLLMVSVLLSVRFLSIRP